MYVFSTAPPFFDSEVPEEFTEDDFKSYRVNDFAYDLGNNRVMLKWKPIRIPPAITSMFQSPFTLDFSLYSLNPQTKTRSFMMNLATNIPNTGSYEVALPTIDDPYMVGAIGISVSENSISGVLGDLNDGNHDDKTIRDIVDNIKKLRNVRKYFKNPVTLLKDIATDAAKRIGCEAFCAVEPDNIGNEINQRLPPCPPTSNRARRESQFSKENPFLEYLTVGTFGQCFSQSVFDRYVNKYINAFVIPLLKIMVGS